MIAQGIQQAFASSTPVWHPSKHRRGSTAVLTYTGSELPLGTKLSCCGSWWQKEPGFGFDFQQWDHVSTPGILANFLVYKETGIVRHLRCGKEVCRISI